MNHYPMHPGDYLRDTSHLSLIEDAIYRRAIDWLYINERPLPADIKKAARLLRAADHLEAVDAVFEEFLTLTDDGWTQARVDREIADYRARADSARENGRKGGRPKTETKPKETDPVNSGYPKITEPKTNQNQNQNQYIPPTPQGGDEDEIPAGWKADSRRSSGMSLDWEPDPKTMGAYLNGRAVYGRPVTAADVFTWLPDWRQSANASGKTMTDAQWTLRLVKYVMACMTSDGATPTNRRASAPQEDPLAFSEENRPERGPYALFKPGPKKTPMTDEGRARVEQLRRQAFGDAA